MELLIALLLCAAAMIVLWLWQLRSRRADWVDAAWAILIGVQAIGFAAVGGGAAEKRLLGALLAVTWSSRLAAHLIQRLSGHGQEDGRYQAMRAHFGHRANV